MERVFYMDVCYRVIYKYKKERGKNIRVMVECGMMRCFLVIKNVYKKVLNNMRKYKC